MDFTREPIIETVITPKEGCKIVVRSSKNVAQEEYFVDSLEVVSFGHALFFRSLEKPKAFLVPASDYEILEVREARMVLKNVGLDRSIKIGGGRETKLVKEPLVEKPEPVEIEETPTAEEPVAAPDIRAEKKRDRRRQQRRRRGRDEQSKEETGTSEGGKDTEEEVVSGEPFSTAHENKESLEGQAQVSAQSTPTFMTGLLPPPPTLISETIGRYKENVLFKNAFYTKEEVEEPQEPIEEPTEALEGEHAPQPTEEPHEPKKTEESVEDKPQEPTSSYSEESLISFHSFWDDISEPSMPPLPYIEKHEGEKNLSTESPEHEENKE